MDLLEPEDSSTSSFGSRADEHGPGIRRQIDVVLLPHVVGVRLLGLVAERLEHLEEPGVGDVEAELPPGPVERDGVLGELGRPLGGASLLTGVALGGIGEDLLRDLGDLGARERAGRQPGAKPMAWNA